MMKNRRARARETILYAFCPSREIGPRHEPSADPRHLPEPETQWVDRLTAGWMNRSGPQGALHARWRKPGKQDDLGSFSEEE